ncbi:hypothetical protein B296_00031373 [Ensete ventricosum]|uniref:Uncharacterized protein n=1 Tax=Ensete ventricosum TaxID=4639 RepID=A0A426ZEK8_ENSVE|nr:hypothetical protein B296_00031373 [Ensete ventricosum]
MEGRRDSSSPPQHSSASPPRSTATATVRDRFGVAVGSKDYRSCLSRIHSQRGWRPRTGWKERGRGGGSGRACRSSLSIRVPEREGGTKRESNAGSSRRRQRRHGGDLECSAPHSDPWLADGHGMDGQCNLRRRDDQVIALPPWPGPVRLSSRRRISVLSWTADLV